MKNSVKYIKIILTITLLSAILVAFVSLLKKAEDKYLRSSYPLIYEEEINLYSEEYNVDKTLIYAIIKTESNFRPNAVSSAGAIGLMQIMPSTLEWLTMYTNEDYETLDLYNTQTNIKYGVLYLSILLDRYESESAIICAYNAGIGNVDSWLKNQEYSTDGINIIHIPFDETRAYLDKVLNSKQMYQQLYFSEETQ